MSSSEVCVQRTEDGDRNGHDDRLAELLVGYRRGLLSTLRILIRLPPHSPTTSESVHE